MSNRPPAEPGMHLDEVDTPALLVDLDAFEHNIRLMQSFANEHAISLRPHAKTHKCPEIALQQVRAGAVGICCQKVSEAEAMVEGGLDDILVSNEIVGHQKLARLARLATSASISVCVDHPLQITALNSAAESAGVVLDVLVEIDVGAGRCGVRPMEPALELARQIASSPALRFSGLQAYHGKAQHVRDPDERRRAIEGAANLAMTTVELLRQNNIECPKVTGAGTGTFEYEATSGVYGELQAGSYVFLDADYALNQNEERSLVHSFRHSLFVYTTIMSQPVPERSVLDAGLKAVSVDSGMPTLPDHPGVEFVKAADEHGVLTHLNADPVPIRLGDKIRLIPGHCDPTVNLHDWFVCYRGERVESLWPITARGALL